jgi:hypothetical protein
MEVVNIANQYASEISKIENRHDRYNRIAEIARAERDKKFPIPSKERGHFTCRLVSALERASDEVGCFQKAA